MIRTTSASILFGILAATACGSSSSSSPAASGAPSGACLPYHSSDFPHGENGANCDSTGDCDAPTCICKDGATSDGQRACVSSKCDDASACSTFCQAHGGAGDCGDAGAI